MKKNILLASALATLYGNAASLRAAELDANDLENLPVVLSASRLRQPLLESPSAVTVIDRQMIEASGARHIADLIRFVPGAVVSYNDGNRPVVAIHGMSATYASGVQVLIDGVSVYSPLWGGMQWEELPLSMDDIDRIEVIRGPNAAVFGPNSFMGVINIITRHPASEQGSSMSGNTGNHGVADFSVSKASHLDNGVQFRMTMGQRASDGFDSRPDTQRMLYGNLRGEYQVNPTDSMQLSLRVADNKKDNGDYTASGSNRVPHANRSDLAHIQVRWTHADSSDNELWVQYYHLESGTKDRVTVNYLDSRFYRSLFKGLITTLGLTVSNPLSYTVNSDFSTQRDGVEVQGTKRWSDAVRTVWGMESRRDSAKSETYLGTPSQSAFLTRAYGNLEWRLASNWTLNLAAMAERNSLASTGYSPKAALTWQPKLGHVFRIGSSGSQRTPSIFEARANVSYPVPAEVINVLAPYAPLLQTVYHIVIPTTLNARTSGNVDSETVRTDEIGYSFNVPEWQIGGDFRVASDHYHGLITAVGSNFVNVDRVDVESNDATVFWRPTDRTTLRLAISHIAVSSPTSPASYNNSAPQNTLSLLWDQRITEEWRGSVNYQRVSSMAWTDAGDSSAGNPALPPIEYLNLRLAKKIRASSLHDGEIALVVQNALGNHREYFAGIAKNGTADTIASRTAFLQFHGQF